jgi:hypothetical protein
VIVIQFQILRVIFFHLFCLSVPAHPVAVDLLTFDFIKEKSLNYINYINYISFKFLFVHFLCEKL